MNTPTHNEISVHARHLWHDRGCPTGRDTAIWLEAEHQLSASRSSDPEPKTDTFAARAQNVTASDNLIGYQLPPAATEQTAIQTVLQKNDARAPQAPRRTAPKLKPSATGKPVWPKPHSS
jgi:hypothetical protein